MSTESPAFRELARAEAEEILARNRVGRIAYARGNHVDIEPIHYVYRNGWIYGRTSPGRKLEMTGESWWPVAFEVDEVEEIFSWRSVVVHGGFYVLHEDGPEWERQERERALTLLRGLIPDTEGPGDPVPFRTQVFRIALQEVSGRAAQAGAPASGGGK